MEQIFALVIKALVSQQATDLLVGAAIYIAVPISTHIYIQFIKYDRRERHLPKLGNWTVRGLAFILVFTQAIFIAWRVGGWSVEMAANHAVNIGIFYPTAMWAFMSWLKKKNPDAYSKLNAPRRRNREGKGKDHNTTWDGN